MAQCRAVKTLPLFIRDNQANGTTHSIRMKTALQAHPQFRDLVDLRSRRMQNHARSHSCEKHKMAASTNQNMKSFIACKYIVAHTAGETYSVRIRLRVVAPGMTYTADYHASSPVLRLRPPPWRGPKTTQLHASSSLKEKKRKKEKRRVIVKGCLYGLQRDAYRRGFTRDNRKREIFYE